MNTNEPSESDTTNERARDAAAGSTDGVLSPDDLSIADDEHVRSIGDDRFLVATGGGDSTDALRGRLDEPRSDGGELVAEGSPSPAETLDESEDGFGVDMAVKTDGDVSRHRVTSNDIREVFTEMLRWYAQELDETTEPAETLSILRNASEIDF